MTSSAEIRTAFLEFFRERGHEIVPSSPLVPGNDPTLLFTNAGMVQFKDVFLGREHRPYNRATTSQRCVRAGGKHNDLENVGYTARHHTFFEMLGNFSFGDYFKREAIHFSWDLLTRQFGLPVGRLWVTVFEDDDEAEAVWLNEIGVEPHKVARIGAKDNFWSMGDTGPCGPCTEVFYDHGPGIPGGPPGTPEEHGDRYIEIWNLVFMQYDRSADGTLNPLPKPSVDTGMGLERIAAVLQGVHSNYEIDLFRRLIEAAAAATGTHDRDAASLKVIADHIRSTAFLIVDGVMPSNEGRGYVLRRIMRRAIRHGYKLGQKDAFFYKLVMPLVDEMGEAYPELTRAAETVQRVILQEEERFAETLEHGMRILDESIARLSGSEVSGETVFRLYDTFGFPVDLTADIARERCLTLDLDGFERFMDEQRERARAASHFGADYGAGLNVQGVTEFTGYDRDDDQVRVTALFRDGSAVDCLDKGEKGIVVLEQTPFYGESGGQVGDSGVLEAEGMQCRVEDTQKQGDGVHTHVGTIEEGRIAVDDIVSARVDVARRNATRLNHSATHLLHGALRAVLGEHVTQKGSLVAPEKLRFDFSHYEPVTGEQLQEIEDIVNGEIRSNVAADTDLMSYDDAIESGAMALFGEKYGDKVRVLRFGNFSVELCGGTHVERTGDIGVFKITHEGGVASGVRRIEAVTGKGAMEWIDANQRTLNELAGVLKSQPDQAAAKVEQLLRANKDLEKRLATARHALLTGESSEQEDYVREISGIKVLATQVVGVDAKVLRQAVDRAKDKLQNAVVVLGSVDDGKVRLAAGVTKNNIDRIRAGDLVKFVADQVGGKGGGRPDFAQAGGTDPSKLEAALESVHAWVAEQLG